VKRLNAIRAELQALPKAGFQLNGLKREELIAANSMLLHELYFDSLGGRGAAMAPPMGLALAASFGSAQRWQAEFSAMAKALGGGSGWVLLSFSPREGRLVNQWAADHAHAMAGAMPLLALDMYEHAYHMDFGADAAAYVDAFMASVDWAKVYARYQQAVHAASEGLAADAQRLDGARLIDVRRAAVFEQAGTMLPGAIWRDPAQVDAWAGEATGDVVLYCVYGHEVCRATALRLQAQGLQARFLPGGIDAWQAAGRPLASKPGAA
jgi:Fe-Mn family superoxide dismutase